MAPRPTTDEAVKAAMDRLATPDPSQPDNVTPATVMERALQGTSAWQRGALLSGMPQMLTRSAVPGVSTNDLIALGFAMGVRLGREIE